MKEAKKRRAHGGFAESSSALATNTSGGAHILGTSYGLEVRRTRGVVIELALFHERTYRSFSFSKRCISQEKLFAFLARIHCR